MNIGRMIVIGAGISGVSIGRQLAKDGFNVTILDSGRPGAGATAAAFGSLTPYSDQTVYSGTREFVRKSVDLYPSWVEEIRKESGMNVDYDNDGLLEVVFSKDDFETMKNTAEEFRRKGYAVNVLNRAQVIEAEPHISDKIVGALHLPEPCVDTDQLFAACKRAAESVGCEIIPNTEAVDVITNGKQVTGVKLDSDRQIPADAVVLASGADIPTIGGSEVYPVTKVRGEAIEVKGPARYLRHQLYDGGSKGDAMKGFITPRRDGRLLLGASYETNPDDGNPNTISVRMALMTMEANLVLVPSLVDRVDGNEGLDLFRITRMWKGWRAKTTKDSQPIIGKSVVSGLYFALGLFGLGFTMAPMIALTISNLAKGAKAFCPPDIIPTRLGL